MKLKKQDLECIHPAKDKLAKNFRYHITINELAKELGLNRTKLQYAFKNLYGLSIAIQSSASYGKSKRIA